MQQDVEAWSIFSCLSLAFIKTWNYNTVDYIYLYLCFKKFEDKNLQIEQTVAIRAVKLTQQAPHFVSCQAQVGLCGIKLWKSSFTHLQNWNIS